MCDHPTTRRSQGKEGSDGSDVNPFHQQVESIVKSLSSANLVAQRLKGPPTTQVNSTTLPSWVAGDPEVIIREQCLVEFIVDEHHPYYIWCYVMPIMSVYRVLLGRPWQSDQGVIYNGWENSYNIQGNNLTVTY